MPTHRFRPLSLTPLLVAAALLACGSDPEGPDAGTPDGGATADLGVRDSGPLETEGFSAEVTNVPTLRGSLLSTGDGTLHLAFQSGAELRYGKRTGTTWAFQSLPAVNPDWTAIALDDAGKVVIATLDYDQQGDGQKHVRLLKEADAFAPVDLGPGADRVDLAIHQGGAHVVSGSQYYRPSGAAHETVQLATFATATSLAFDAAGRAHFVYADPVARKLMHQVRTATSADTTTLHDGRSPGGAIRRSADGLVVVFEDDADFSQARLRVARESGGTWTTEELGGGVVGQIPRLAVSGGGALHVVQGGAYWTGAAAPYTNKYLNLMSYAPVDVDVAVDDSGRPHVAWSTGAALVYLTPK